MNISDDEVSEILKNASFRLMPDFKGDWMAAEVLASRLGKRQIEFGVLRIFDGKSEFSFRDNGGNVIIMIAERPEWLRDIALKMARAKMMLGFGWHNINEKLWAEGMA